LLEKKYQIHVFPQNKRISVNSNQSLIEALMDQGIFLRSDCGGKGKCGKCRVLKVLHNGHLEEIASCTYKVEADISIKIPETSLLSPQIMSKAPVAFPAGFKERFKHVQAKDSYGIAADLGTTTIAIYLCNKSCGKVVSSLAVKNPQALYGDDVMSRIGTISQTPANLGLLQKLVVTSIEWGIKELLSSSQLDGDSISEMVVVGNPAMIHILAGVDPKSIGISPYQPAFYDARCFKSGELGFGLQDFMVQTLPQVSGFIGGDILAAALSVDLENQPDGTLLIDLGTNGELMLKSKDGFFATSCATGPAFEGASLSCGMQAIPGAVNAIEISEDQRLVRYSMINPAQSSKVKPAGICGPGVINAVAQFYKSQIIDSGGKFRSDNKFILVPENSSAGQASIFITQKDIRSVQLGKSALFTGIEFLLQKAGMGKPVKLIIAGAFGSHLDKSDMITTGMIPDIDPEIIELAGNSAGSGAIMTLCDNRYLEMATQMAAKITPVDLACNKDFQEMFIKNLSFPL
jgi:uncharacterized 2Fe-2S/4Fe-4S cluster protein (DUF4445 family)